MERLHCNISGIANKNMKIQMKNSLDKLKDVNKVL